MTTLRLVLAVLFVSAVPVPAKGQVVPPSGLGRTGFFGESEPVRQVKHKLDLTLTAEGANDSDTPPEVRSVTGAQDTFGGYSTLVTGGADYKLTRSRFQLAASGSGVWRNYAEAQDVPTSRAGTGALGFTASVNPRLTLTANQSFAYSPSYLYGVFPTAETPSPGDSIPTAPNYTVDDTGSYYYRTTVSVERGLSPRSSLAVGGDLSYTNYIEDAESRPDLDSRTGSVSYDHHLSKNVLGRTTYHYTNGTFGYTVAGLSADLRTTEQGVDVGLTYSRPLSATRKMDIGVSLGGLTMKVPALVDGTVDRTRFNKFSGDLSVSWDFAPNWYARGAVERGVEYLATIGQPALLDSASLLVGGLMTRRVAVSAAAGIAKGHSVLSSEGQLLDTYSTDFRLQVALSRTLAAHGQFFYYYYAFDQNALSPRGIPPALERTGVRLGLTLWLPTLRR